MDVKTTFLNGELEEEIYMDQPDDFVVKGQEGMVCKLLKYLYCLKQVPKQWHEKFDKTLTSVGFVVNEANKFVYYHFGGSDGVILCLYVDDILIFGTRLNVIKEVKEFLSQNFEMKDLGVADVILNIKLVTEGDGGVTLLKSYYVEKVLSRFGYSDCKPALTPYDASMILKKNKRIMRDQLRYSQIIGSLMPAPTPYDASMILKKNKRIMRDQLRYSQIICSLMPTPTPYDASMILNKNKRIMRDQLRYSQIIGSLMYLASAKRPDISFAMSKHSRFVSNLGDDHWHAVERVMRYLKGIVNYGIHYSVNLKAVEGYSDSNWIYDVDEIKATSEYAFTLRGGVVSWKSCKQTISTRSTMEVELIALDTTTVEAEWLRELLMDLLMVEKMILAILMNCDNETMITKVNSSKDNMKSSRHVKRQ
jgi:hypothetical protein